MEEYVSIEAVLQKFLDLSQDQDNLRPGFILDIADDIIDRLVPPEQYEWNIFLIKLDSRSFVIPRPLRQIVQALYLNDPRPVSTTEVVSWTHQVWGSGGCQLEVTPKCSPCQTYDPNDPAVAVVNLTGLENLAYPDAIWGHSKFYKGERGAWNQKRWFYPMKTRSNNFHNVPYHINGCLNINFDSDIEYEVRNRIMRLNRDQGWVLISGRCEVLDENGYRRVPNNSNVFDTITHFIEYRLAYERWRNGPRKDRSHNRELQAYNEQKYKECFRRATADLMFPEYPEWVDFMDNHWMKYHPYYSRRDNLNRYQEDQFKIGF